MSHSNESFDSPVIELNKEYPAVDINNQLKEGWIIRHRTDCSCQELVGRIVKNRYAGPSNLMKCWLIILPDSCGEGTVRSVEGKDQLTWATDGSTGYHTVLAKGTESVWKDSAEIVSDHPTPGDNPILGYPYKLEEISKLLKNDMVISITPTNKNFTVSGQIRVIGPTVYMGTNDERYNEYMIGRCSSNEFNKWAQGRYKYYATFPVDSRSKAKIIVHSIGGTVPQTVTSGGIKTMAAESNRAVMDYSIIDKASDTLLVDAAVMFINPQTTDMKQAILLKHAADINKAGVASEDILIINSVRVSYVNTKK